MCTSTFAVSWALDHNVDLALDHNVEWALNLDVERALDHIVNWALELIIARALDLENRNRKLSKSSLMSTKPTKMNTVVSFHIRDN